MAGVTAGQLAQEIAVARGRVQQLHDAAEESGAGDDNLLAANRRAVVVHGEAVESWGGKQAQEVLAGSRAYARWHDMGETLRTDAEYLLNNFNDTAGWFTKAAVWIGEKLSSGQEAVAQKVAALRADVQAVSKLRSIVQQRSALLQARKVPLSAEVRDALFGLPAQLAEESWSKLNSLLDGLLRAVSSVVGGSAEFRDNGNGDLEAVALNGPTATMLGVVQFAVGGVIATIAICVALVVAVRAHYQHADEVTRAELESQENALVQAGQLSPADLAKLRELRAQSDENRKPDDLTTTIIKTTLGIAAGAGALWVGWKLLDRVIFGKGGR